MRYVLSLALGLFTLNAYAAFTLTELETDQARAGLQASLLQNVPMVQVLSNYVPTYLTKATELAAELKKFPQWEALASARRGPFTLVVETPVQREVQGRALKPQLQTDRWNSISEIGSKYSTDPSLHARLKEVALSLSARDSRALLTGVINSLPPEKRGPYFKLGAPAAQLQGLQGEEALTDQALSANFRAAAFGFTPEQVQRSFLLATIEESIQLERELELLARAAWFRLMKDRDSSALDLNPENVRALAAELKLEPKSAAVIERAIKSAYNENDYEAGVQKIETFSPALTIEEQTPYAGMFRGCLMGDCSTVAYGFALSPQEYVYLVKDPAGTPLAMMVGTLVAGPQGEKILFVHDFGGGRLLLEHCDLAIRALYEKRAELGFDLITVAAANGNSGGWSVWVGQNRPSLGTVIAQNYLDADMRNTIKTITSYPYAYDMPSTASNRQALVYTPATARNLRISAVKQGGSAIEPAKEIKRSEAILRALDFARAGKGAVVTPAMLVLGIKPEELTELMSHLNNSAGLPVAKYYATLEEFFARYDLRMSRHFVRDREYLFYQGHLSAPDALTSEDAALVNQTQRWLIQLLKQEKPPEYVFKLLESGKEHLQNSEAFQRYLQSFTGHGAHEAGIVEKLLAIGYEPTAITMDQEIALRFILAGSPTLRLWLLEKMSRENLARLPAEAVRKLALDLAADDDLIPRRASKLLLYTNNADAAVMEELKKTGHEEDERDIAMRAIIAYTEAGGESSSFPRRLRKHAENPELDQEIRERIALLLPMLPPPDEKDCEDAVTSSKPRN